MHAEEFKLRTRAGQQSTSSHGQPHAGLSDQHGNQRQLSTFTPSPPAPLRFFDVERKPPCPQYQNRKTCICSTILIPEIPDLPLSNSVKNPSEKSDVCQKTVERTCHRQLMFLAQPRGPELFVVIVVICSSSERFFGLWHRKRAVKFLGADAGLLRRIRHPS